MDTIKKILVIDDEENTRRLFAVMLDKNYDLTTVSGGKEAVQLVKENIRHSLIPPVMA